MRRLAVAAGAVLLGLAGAWTAVCAVAFYSTTLGLGVGVVATAAAIHALPAGWLRFGFTAGWLSVLGIAVLGRAEGDWVIQADWHGYSLLAASLGFLMYVVVTIPRRVAQPGGGHPTS